MKLAAALALPLGLILSAPGVAQDLNSMMRANELGAVLASEGVCKLSLNQAGIEAWIAANVAADDLSFAPNLSVMIMGQEHQIQGLSDSAKIAHCAAVRQTAKTMGLID
jgi:hypothetical protein